jgi:hypothetical protein
LLVPVASAEADDAQHEEKPKENDHESWILLAHLQHQHVFESAVSGVVLLKHDM